MKVKYRHIVAFHNGWEVPRKVKKSCIGTKIPAYKLKLKIAKWMKNPEKHTTFCPNCGEGGEMFINHEVGYPELQVEGFCLRCGTKTSWADNSPWYHILEIMKENNT